MRFLLEKMKTILPEHVAKIRERKKTNFSANETVLINPTEHVCSHTASGLEMSVCSASGHMYEIHHPINVAHQPHICTGMKV
jgi:hypothetical protein